MAKLIDERIERLGWELEGLNAEIEDRVADLKRELEHPTSVSNFACGGGQLDILLTKRAAKQEELKALQRIAEEERKDGRMNEIAEALMSRDGLTRAEAEEVIEGVRQMRVRQ